VLFLVNVQVRVNFAIEAAVSYERTVSAVSDEDNQWCVTDDKTDESETFDCVVLTMPVPQILELSGNIQSAIGEAQCMDTDFPQLQKMGKIAFQNKFCLLKWKFPNCKNRHNHGICDF